MIEVKVLVRTVPSCFMFDSERYVATDICMYLYITMDIFTFYIFCF